MENIIIEVYNKFTTETLFKWELFYDKEKACFGKYSSFWRKVRNESANQYRVDKHWIRCKISKVTTLKKRCTLSYPNGLSIDLPHDMNEKDFNIVGLYLEALKLAHSA
jgi:hypothetical protein